MINATNEFLHTGSAKRLKDFFAEKKTGNVGKIVEQIDKFSTMINMCSFKGIDDVIKNLVGDIYNLLDNQETAEKWMYMSRCLISNQQSGSDG